MDESGQDTSGKIFIVAIVVVGLDREKTRAILKDIEKASGKKERKWTRSTPVQRIKYLENVFSHLPDTIHYYCANHARTRAYHDLTVTTTAAAIQYAGNSLPYHAVVFVDGLKRTERNRFGSDLRKLGVRIYKVRGIRDQSDEFIRLADAVAGLARDALDNNTPLKEWYERLVESGKIRLL